MVGNAATWAGCTDREIQIPSAWSATSITITANIGEMAAFAGEWLYVVNAAGEVNANGFLLEAGAPFVLSSEVFM